MDFVIILICAIVITMLCLLKCHFLIEHKNYIISELRQLNDYNSTEISELRNKCIDLQFKILELNSSTQ